MHSKILLCFCLFFMATATASAQSIYHFSYNFHSKEDSVNYQAFYIRYDDGNGLLRIRYESPVNKEDMVVEMDTEEQYVTDNSGLTDSTKVFFTGTNPRVITGDSKQTPTLPSFIFKVNPSTEFIDPAGVVVAGSKKEMSTQTFFEGELMEAQQLSKTFFQQFFSEDEDLYVNFFATRTRGLSPIEKSTRLFLIVVANTNEKVIGASCEKDMQKASQLFRDMAAYLAIRIDSVMIFGNNYGKRNVLRAIDALKPNLNDIVVFYYSGHGFRKNDAKHFPYLDLRSKPSDNYLTETINIEDIFNMLKKKGARFNLVVSDCCNTDVEATNSTGSKPFKTKGSGVTWNEDNIRNLFLNKKPMSILATAAQSGQKASSNNSFGGFFSYFFKSSVENYCSILKPKVNWDQVFEDIKKQTIEKANHTYCDKPYIPANICQQYPVYMIR